MVRCETVESLLGRIASAGPSGGGGAAAALTGATAAALVAMAAGVAARRAPEDSGLREIVDDMQALRARMVALIEEDVATFGRVVEARRLADDARAGAMRDALIGATEVPLELAAASAHVLEQCAAMLPRARPSTLADLGVAAALAAAALEGAALTARANLAALDGAAPEGTGLTARANLEGVSAPVFVAESRKRLDRLLREGATLRAGLPRAGEDSGR